MFMDSHEHIEHFNRVHKGLDVIKNCLSNKYFLQNIYIYP